MAVASRRKDNAAQYIAAAIVIVIIVGALLFVLSTRPGVPSTVTTSTTTVSPSSGYGNMSVQLTDPPLVPSGTQSLIIAYSGVSLHETGMANTTGFVNFNASGTINLVNLTNVSQTIAIIRTQLGQSFNLIRFNIVSAAITIDNATYNVTVPSGGVVARINTSVNSSATGGLLIDLSPAVLQVYTSANQTVFVMVPSATAIAIGKAIATGNIGYRLGARTSLQGKFAASVYAQRPNVSITSATAAEAGNVTTLQVTVKNNGNRTVVLSDVSLRGFFEAIPWSGSWVPPKYYSDPVISGSGYGSGSIGGDGYGTYINVSANGRGTVGPTPSLNSSLNATVAADSPGNAGFGIAAASVFNRNFHNQLNFIIASNGTLELPYSLPVVNCPAILVSTGTTANASAGSGCRGITFGYSLAAGASETLAFNGVITMPNVGVVVAPGEGVITSTSASGAGGWIGPRVQSATVVLIPNQTYNVAVHGQYGVSATAAVKATGYVTNYAAKLVDVTSVNLSLHDTTTGTRNNETVAGFISHTNSTVAYSVYSYGGPFAKIVPTLPSYELNVTGFSISTPGFTLLNWSVLGGSSSPCPPPPCGPGMACPAYACVGGTGRVYLLNIRTPPTNYTGTLAITENYTEQTNTTKTNSSSSGTLNVSQQQANARQNGLVLPSTYFACTSNSACEKVPIAACQNGLAAQSACINSAYYPQYSAAYNSSIHPEPCPLYIVDINVSCSCDLQTNSCVENWAR